MFGAGHAAYRPRARKPLWPCVGAALAPPPVTCLCVLISLRKMRCERAKMAIFLWLAPRPALAGSSLIGGRRAARARRNGARARYFLILLFLISHGSDTLFHFLSHLPAASRRWSRGACTGACQSVCPCISRSSGLPAQPEGPLLTPFEPRHHSALILL